MKTFILYGSPEKIAGRRQTFIPLDGLPYYIRAEKSNGSLMEALEEATPEAGETVLNTVEI